MGLPLPLLPKSARRKIRPRERAKEIYTNDKGGAALTGRARPAIIPLFVLTPPPPSPLQPPTPPPGGVRATSSRPLSLKARTTGPAKCDGSFYLISDMPWLRVDSILRFPFRGLSIPKSPFLTPLATPIPPRSLIPNMAPIIRLNTLPILIEDAKCQTPTPQLQTIPQRTTSEINVTLHPLLFTQRGTAILQEFVRTAKEGEYKVQEKGRKTMSGGGGSKRWRQ